MNPELETQIKKVFQMAQDFSTTDFDQFQNLLWTEFEATTNKRLKKNQKEEKKTTQPKSKEEEEDEEEEEEEEEEEIYNSEETQKHQSEWKKCKNIIKSLKKEFPSFGLFPDEKIFYNHENEKGVSFEGYTQKNTLYVDEFLYPTADDLDHYLEENGISSYYCDKCGNTKTVPFNIISHSATLIQLRWIFSKQVLGNLEGKTVVDIGSRLGNVLYIGYISSKAKKLIGVEISKGWCDFQEKFVKQFQMEDRIEVMHNDILNCAHVLQNADVVVMNNVFEFFASAPDQEKLWKFIFQNLPKGASLVTLPSLKESFEDAQIGFKYSTYVQEKKLRYPHTEDPDELENYELVHLYQVK